MRYKTVSNLGPSRYHPKEFFCNLGRTWANAINDAQKIFCILSNSAKFSAGRPLLTACRFWTQWPLPLALIVWRCGLLNILATESMQKP